MQLKYRGQTYDYLPPQVEMTSTAELGQYRGLEWRFRKPRQVPVAQATLDLMYRGVAYQTGDQPAPVTAVSSVPTRTTDDRPSVENMARALMMSHYQWLKFRQQSMLSRAATQVGMGPATAHYWNHIQGKVHPSFRTSYDHSHVALS